MLKVTEFGITRYYAKDNFRRHQSIMQQLMPDYIGLLNKTMEGLDMLKKFFAKIGAVGGTARWAASMYHRLENLDPGIRGQELYVSLIAIRYPRPHPNGKALLALTGKMKGLKGFVVVVLTIEAGFLDNSAEDLSMFLQVITKELAKKGVPEEIASH